MKARGKINKIIKSGGRVFLKKSKEEAPETRAETGYGWTLEDSIKNGLNLLPAGYVRLSESPEVITAVDRIADLISNMTIHLMRNTKLGDVRVNNTLSKKIDINPCEGLSKKAWLHFIVRTLLLEGDGNAVVLPEYSLDDNGTNYIKNLLPVPAKDFEIIPGPTFEDGYTIQIADRIYKPEDVIHFRINPDPKNFYKGTSYRFAMSQLAETLKSSQKAKQEFLDGRYMPSLIVRVDSDADEVNTDEGKKKLLASYSTSDTAGAPWIIPAEYTDVFSVTPLSLTDIGVIDSVAQDKETIAALLGVPSFILGVGEFNADEYNNFVKDKVLAIAKEIEQTLTSKLLVSSKLYFKFNVRSLYSYDLNTLAEVGGAQFDRGIMTGNEVRDWLGMSPLEGLDEVKILENYIPAEDSGNQKKLNNGGSDSDDSSDTQGKSGEDEQNEEKDGKNTPS